MKLVTLSNITDLFTKYHAKVKELLDKKVDKVDGKGLSTEDFTTEMKTKLTNLTQTGEYDDTAVQTHMADTDIHVTTTDKTTWNGKQDALTFDNTPTDTSTNPVTSGGIFTALSDKADATDIPTKVSDLTNDSGFTKVEASTTNGNIKIDGVETTVYTLGTLTKADVGLGNVDNTSDADKPISTATQTALTNLETTCKTYTDDAISDLVGGAPETLDTLKELADALGEDANLSTTITTELANKVDKVDGKQLSTEDYTTAEKTKLAGMEECTEAEMDTIITDLFPTT